MSEDVRWVKTHCARMDHGGCGLLVGVADDRIVKVKGDPKGFLNEGYMCVKGLRSVDKLNHPDRLRHPLRRLGERGEGKWEQVTWDDALSTIAENLLRAKEQYGARSVAFGAGMPKGLDHFMQIRLANVFGSPNVIASQDVCHAPREITGVHTCGFYPVADFHHPSKLVVLWGSNITATNEEGEICSLLMHQLQEGTELIVVDPRRIDLAGRSQHWLQLRPGTDSALALGFLNVIIDEQLYDTAFVERWTYGFEELAAHVRAYTPERVSSITWVPADLIRRAARAYATTKPAALQWGNPIEHTTQVFDTARALVCLMAITGNLDVPGGNVKPRDPQMQGLGAMVRADLIPGKRKEMVANAHGIIPRLMTNAPAYFRKAVLEGVPYPIRAAFMICANPMLSYANSSLTYEALMKLDFLAVSDIVMTPTAALADVVLPAATQFEFNDIGHVGVGHGFILARPKIVEPPDECWPDIKTINALGKLMTDERLWRDDFNDFAEEAVRPAGLTYAEFCERGYLRGPETFGDYEEQGFSTPTRKVELCLSTAEKFGLPPLPDFRGVPEEEDDAYPLVLTSAKSRYYLHSSYRWLENLRKLSPAPSLEIHPETAAEYGITEGDEVLIETRHGKATHLAHLTETVDPRVVCGTHGWWFPEAGVETLYDWKRSNFNMLTSVAQVGKEFGTPNLKGLACRVSRSSGE